MLMADATVLVKCETGVAIIIMAEEAFLLFRCLLLPILLFMRMATTLSLSTPFNPCYGSLLL